LQEFDNRRRPESYVGRFTLLHWNPRLVAVVAVIMLVLVALAGLGIELTYNLYW
jgi:hypothetical protein